MEFKKTRGSYVIWLLYTLCVWILTSLGTMELCLKYRMTDISIIICIVVLLSVISLSYFGIRMGINHFYDYLYLNGKRANLFEKIAAGIILVIGIGYRVSLIFNDSYLSIMTYYEMSKVGTIVQMPDNLSVMERFYICLLSMIFTFFGNKLIVGLVFQCILFLLGTAFLYMGIRTVCGRTPALLTLTGVAFLPEFISKSTNCIPSMLYYFAFGITVWGIGLYLKRRSEDDIYHAKDMLSVILPAVSLGILAYLDFGSIVLFVFFLMAGFVVKEESRNSVGKIYLQLPIAVISALAAFSICCLLKSLLDSLSFFTVIGNWLQIGMDSARQIRFIGNAFQKMVCGVPVFSLLIFVFLIWLSFSFFMEKKQEKITAWFLVCIAAYLFGYANLSIYYDIILLIGIFVLAGSGLQGVFAGLDDLVGVSYDNIPLETEQASKDSSDEKPTYNTTLLENDKKPVQFIPNPLPTPKPHIKKTMGYAFEPEQKDMKYDIHVSDNDDFDIKV